MGVEMCHEEYLLKLGVSLQEWFWSETNGPSSASESTEHQPSKSPSSSQTTGMPGKIPAQVTLPPGQDIIWGIWAPEDVREGGEFSLSHLERPYSSVTHLSLK
jgi:hypothetical protein